MRERSRGESPFGGGDVSFRGMETLRGCLSQSMRTCWDDAISGRCAWSAARSVCATSRWHSGDELLEVHGTDSGPAPPSTGHKRPPGLSGAEAQPPGDSHPGAPARPGGGGGLHPGPTRSARAADPACAPDPSDARGCRAPTHCAAPRRRVRTDEDSVS